MFLCRYRMNRTPNSNSAAGDVAVVADFPRIYCPVKTKLAINHARQSIREWAGKLRGDAEASNANRSLQGLPRSQSP